MDDVTSSKPALEQVQQLVKVNEKLTALHWISAQIATEQDLQTLYNLIINGFSDITGISKCAFYLVNDDYEFKEVTTRIKGHKEPFWLCSGTISALQRALKERLGIITLNQRYCSGCNESCSNIRLHVCALYNRSGKPTGVLVGYEFELDKYNDDTNESLKILELFTIQVSLALENAMLNSKLRGLAITDGLTGLYNHRHFMDCLANVVKRSLNKKTCFSLLLMDVDDFKSYNDRYGHLAGDHVLQAVASIMTRTVSSMGTVFRYGGEEFTVILPGISLEDGFDIAEKTRKNIADCEFKNRNITISIGIAEFPNHAQVANELVEFADQGLYIAKSNGKNMVYSVK